jgi:hypothetical protein
MCSINGKSGKIIIIITTYQRSGLSLKVAFKWVWYCTPLIPALRRLM